MDQSASLIRWYSISVAVLLIFYYIHTEFSDKNCEIVMQASEVTAFIIFYEIHTVWIYRKTVMIRKQNFQLSAKLNVVYQEVMAHTRLQLELTVKIIVTVDVMQRNYKTLIVVPRMILDARFTMQSFRARQEPQ